MTAGGIHVWRSPAFRFAGIALLGALFTAWIISVALSLPRLGAELRPGVVIRSSAGELKLEPLDLMGEPGELTTHGELNRFYERQAVLARLVAAPGPRAVGESGEMAIAPGKRSWRDLPGLFWIQIFVGVGALFISGWIWSLRPRDPAVALFAMSGFSTFLSALPSAVYTTRELFIEITTFRTLETMNAWGASLFGIHMIALFLIYPARLPAHRFLAIFQCAFFLLWTISFSLQWAPDWANISLIIVTMMAIICVAIGCQFFATRGDPRGRAALSWIGLSVLVGAGGFVGLNTVPLVFGMPPLNQGYAFLFFLVIYFGLAAGLTRYRLFEVGDWAFKFLFYALGAAGLVLLDAALVFVAGLDRVPSLGIALLAVGFIYLPFRDAIASYVRGRGAISPHEFLNEALKVAFASSAAERSKKWEELLRKLFNPLEIGPLGEQIQEVEIREDGLVLAIPPVAGTPPLRLAYGMGGRGLFSNRSLEYTRQIAELIYQAETSREAYDRGTIEERRRVAQDLHDDVGARLLSGIYSADEKHRPILQAALADVRSIVGEFSGESALLEDVLADLRHEAANRLADAGIELSWPDLPGVEGLRLAYRQQKTCRSVLRELVSNVIRHSGASRVEIHVSLAGEMIQIEARDNGKGISEPALSGNAPGYGLKNLKQRLADSGGVLEISSSSAGTLVSFGLPVSIK
jgi:signal transduction histidine kinase